MNEEQTLALEELGKVETVKVYNQAYVDKQQKCIAELKEQNEWLEGCKLELAEHLGKANDRIAELVSRTE